MSDALADRLAASENRLRAFLRGNAGPLLRHEDVDDLVQGVHARAAAAAADDRFAGQGEDAFFAWLCTLARRHCADRARRWRALRRDGGALLRVTRSEGGVEPRAQDAGPATFAERREQVLLAAKALALLPERDRRLVAWACDDVPLQEAASRLGVGYEAAKRARQRALERFRATHALLSKARRLDSRS